MRIENEAKKESRHPTHQARMGKYLYGSLWMRALSKVVKYEKDNLMFILIQVESYNL